MATKNLKVTFEPTKENSSSNNAAKRKRFRRARSAPLVRDRSTEQATEDPSSPNNPESLLKSIHPSLRKVAAILVMYLSAGVVCFYLIRHHISGKKTNSVLDALYFCVITMTTAGYGDLAPDTDLAKIFASAYVFIGLGLVGLILSKAADYLVEKQEALLVKAFNMREELGPSAIMKKIGSKKAQHKCILVSIIILVLILVGTLFLRFVEKMRFFEAFYCVCATVTTLGYGYPSFSTLGGRIFAVLWILIGTVFVAQFFLCLAELNSEKRQKHLVDCVLTRRMTNLDIEAADIDDDGVVDAAEFALYKLKEMGKITEEDVTLVMTEFHELDVDQSGTLSCADITLAQCSPKATKPASEEKGP